MRSPERRGSAALRIAEWKARHGSLHEARNLVVESLAASPEDLRALEMQVALIGA